MTDQKEMSKAEIERMAHEVHGVYCMQYAINEGKEYWTNYEYWKLPEKVKDFDRALVAWHLTKMEALRAELSRLTAALSAKDAELGLMREKLKAYTSFYVLYENSGSWSYDSKEGIFYWKITDDECNALDHADRGIDRVTATKPAAEPTEPCPECHVCMSGYTCTLHTPPSKEKPCGCKENGSSDCAKQRGAWAWDMFCTCTCHAPAQPAQPVEAKPCRHRTVFMSSLCPFCSPLAQPVEAKPCEWCKDAPMGECMKCGKRGRLAPDKPEGGEGKP